MSLALVTSVFGKYIKFYVCSKEVNKSPGPTQEMLSKSWWQLLLHRVLKFLLLKLRCAGSKRTNYWDVVLVICHKQIEDSRNWKTESPLILFDQSFSCGASSEEANLPQEFEWVGYVSKMQDGMQWIYWHLLCEWSCGGGGGAMAILPSI